MCIIKKVLFLSFLGFALASYAYSEDTTNTVCEKYIGVSGLGEQMLSADILEGLKDAKDLCLLSMGYRSKEPDYINKAMRPFIERHNGFAFLKDVNIKIKTFDTKNAENGLGFSYDYVKTFKVKDYKYNEVKDVTTGCVWDFNAKGNVAFNSDINPANFLDNRFSLSGFHNQGGVLPNNFDLKEQKQKNWYQKLNELENELAKAETQEQHNAILAQKNNIINAVRQTLSLQTYVDFNVNAGLESNQRFTQRQWSYGAQVSVEIKSYDRNAWQTKANIFDYPFALIRLFTGYNTIPEFVPYGSSIPTIVFGLDQVDPENNSAREALEEASTFDRYRCEIYFRSPIAYIGGNEIFFNFDYRYLHEIDAPTSIKASDIDKFEYTVISITSSNGVFVSYTDGKLPFDLSNHQAYELGWKFHL